MRLVRIFSNKNFINIKLNRIFNVVLATIHDKTQKKDTHNLGKTSLIHVVDFLLLAKFEKGKGLLGNPVFQGQIFYLEIELNSAKYLIIRRSIDTPSKISFKENDLPLSDFTVPSEWDVEDLSFEKAKDKLNEYLSFDALTNFGYRKSITYFLRSQQDYTDVFQLSKFKGPHKNWKPFVFELLGFNGNLIVKKLELEQEAEDQKKRILLLQKENRIDTKEKDKILGLIDIRQREKDVAEETIDKFNFFLQDKFLTKDLIEDLDFKIQTLNTERYRIGYEITKTEESLQNAINDVNVAKLKELFKEVNLYFPNILINKYEDLEQFNKSISNERKKYLADNLQELKNEFTIVNKELEQLEKTKSEQLSFLTEKDSYSKFKVYQKQLAQLEAEIELLNEKLRLIDISIEIEEKISQLNEQIDDSIEIISQAISERKHAEINKIFNDIITDIVRRNALISIKQNNQGNVEFSAEYVNSADRTSTSEAEGTSYKKILCMAFDLSLLIYYSNNSFFRFAYHDGILEGLDNRIKLLLLDKLKSICQKYNLQLIISLIDSDLPMQNDGTLFQFNQDEICLQLNDLNDQGKLFLNSF